MSVITIPRAGESADQAASRCWLTCAVTLECRGVFVWRLRVVPELRVGLAPFRGRSAHPVGMPQPFALGCAGWRPFGTLGYAQRCA